MIPSPCQKVMPSMNDKGNMKNPAKYGMPPPGAQKIVKARPRKAPPNHRKKVTAKTTNLELMEKSCLNPSPRQATCSPLTFLPDGV